MFDIIIYILAGFGAVCIMILIWCRQVIQDAYRDQMEIYKARKQRLESWGSGWECPAAVRHGFHGKRCNFNGCNNGMNCWKLKSHDTPH